MADDPNHLLRADPGRTRGQVTTEHVFGILQPLWRKVPETAFRLRGRIEKVLDAARAKGYRVATRFALVAVSGELARVILDLPWAEGEAEHAAVACFDAWREARGGEGPGELVSAMDALLAATQSHGESRFRDLELLPTADPPTPVQHSPIRNQLGYRFLHEGELVWGFTPTGWREVIGGVGQPSTVAKLLAERGVLVTGADWAHRLPKWIDGRTQNLFVVKASALEDWA